MNNIPRPLLSRSLQPLATSSRNASPLQPLLLSCQQQRTVTTGRRTRKMLNQPPAPYLGGPTEITGSSGRSRTSNTPPPSHDHIIYNPPPSAPNVYHTPLKFLPQSDIRARLAASSSATTSSTPSPSTTAPINPSSTSWPSNLPLPPNVYNKTRERKYHLTPPDFDEMRRLRREDPAQWTLSRIADRFQCTAFFAGRVTAGIATEEYRREARRPHEEMRKKWGKRRREAREQRVRRREGWSRDE